MELLEHIIEKIPFLPEFAQEALVDSLKLVPFLFIMFLLIEILEQYFTKKKHLVVFFMKKVGPFFGSLFASIPQCGFSVIASTLYTKRILSRGTLLSVYFATSDEAIPVLMSNTKMAGIILPIILIKILVAIGVGYLVDIYLTYKAKDSIEDVKAEQLKAETKGCCKHHFSQGLKSKELWWHPIKHTFNIFLFIFIISLVLGFLIDKIGTEERLANLFLMNSPIQPILVSFIGLIPNCAISVMLTVLFMKNTITFGSLIAGLCSAGGLGLLVLLTKNKDKKDTTIILAIMVVVSSLIGLAIQYHILNLDFFLKS